jgi:uracil-DNA glycosylase
MVFVLWGANAGAKTDLILRSQQGNLRHLIIKAPHPSPLSAYRGFLGCKHFSKCNEFLREHGLQPVDWQIENL